MYNATHGIAVTILSVRPYVRLSVSPSDACIVTKQNDALRIFDTTRNGNDWSSDTNIDWWTMSPSLSNVRRK